jgi:hypothetical protein
MLRRLRVVLIAVGFAALGAMAGRVAAELRRRHELGEPLEVTPEVVTPRPQEIVPGLVAALRVHDRPWSYLHIPSWLAAFWVNFAFSALGRELRPFARGKDGASVEARGSVPEARTIDALPVDAEAPLGAPAAARADSAPAEGFTPFRD